MISWGTCIKQSPSFSKFDVNILIRQGATDIIRSHQLLIISQRLSQIYLVLSTFTCAIYF